MAKYTEVVSYKKVVKFDCQPRCAKWHHLADAIAGAGTEGKLYLSKNGNTGYRRKCLETGCKKYFISFNHYRFCEGCRNA